MEDLIEHLTDAYVKRFMEHLELFLFVPPPGCVIEIPFSPADLMRERRITYGGKSMEPLLRSRDEYQFAVQLGMGLEPMPGHDPVGLGVAELSDPILG